MNENVILINLILKLLLMLLRCLKGACMFGFDKDNSFGICQR